MTRHFLFLVLGICFPICILYEPLLIGCHGGICNYIITVCVLSICLLLYEESWPMKECDMSFTVLEDTCIHLICFILELRYYCPCYADPYAGLDLCAYNLMDRDVGEWL